MFASLDSALPASVSYYVHRKRSADKRGGVNPDTVLPGHISLTAKGIEKGKEIARDHKENTKEDLERRAKEEEKKEEKE